MAANLKYWHGKPLMVDYTPASAVACGDVVLLSGVPCIAHADIAASTLGALATGGGVYVGPKGAGAIAALAPVYWDAANLQVTTTAAGNAYLGRATLAAASDAAEVYFSHVPGDAADRLVYSAVAASAAVSNTVTETDFDKSVTLPAGTLKAGDVVRVRAQATPTAGNSTNTLNLKLKIGSTVVLATGAVDVTDGGGDVGYIEADVVVRTAGASGTMVAAGVTALGVPGTVTAKPNFLASTALDTTAAQAVKVSATWSVANAGNSCRLDVLNVQILRA